MEQTAIEVLSNQGGKLKIDMNDHIAAVREKAGQKAAHLESSELSKMIIERAGAMLTGEIVNSPLTAGDDLTKALQQAAYDVYRATKHASPNPAGFVGQVAQIGAHQQGHAR